MNMDWRRVATVGLVFTLMLAAIGCGPRKEKLPPAPKPPPAPPPRRDVPVDPSLQESAKREILSAAGSNMSGTRAHAVEAMKDGMGPVASPEITRLLNDPDPRVRFAATLAAGELRLVQAKPALVRLAEDRDDSVRIGAKFALHRLGDTSRSRDMEETSRDPRPQIRGMTAMVLGLLGEPSGVNVLRPMLRDQSAAVRLQAAEAMWRLGDQEGLNRLVSSSLSTFVDDQMISILALAGPKDRRALVHVETALASDYEEVTLIAARACGMLGSDAGYVAAIRAANSRDARQRLMAAMALGAIGRTDSQEVLARLLKDGDADVRLGAATAILQLQPQNLMTFR
jgi:HEAT repeat protein